MVPTDNMRVVVDPEPTVCNESNGGLSSAEVFAILRDQQVFSVKEVSIDVVYHAGSAVVRIRPRFSLQFFYGNPTPVKIFRQFPQRNRGPDFILHIQNSPSSF